MTKGQKAQIRRCFEKIEAELDKLQAIADELEDKYSDIPFEKLDSDKANQLFQEMTDLEQAINDTSFGVNGWTLQYGD